MTGVICAVLVVIAGFFAGAANAGEESVMAMRGNPPDGVTPRNMFTMVWPGGVGGTRAHSPARRAASGVEEPVGKTPESRSDGYLRWRDNCVRTPRLVAGRSLELDCAVGFGQAPRFVERPEEEPTGFFELLLKELAPD